MATLRTDVAAKLNEAVTVLDGLEKDDFDRRGLILGPDKWQWRYAGHRWAHLNCGHSGAFLVEAATGELYNIKAYGTPDHNKKAKADLGNILTAELASLQTRRWNYLR